MSFAEQLVLRFALPLKATGYRKKNATWTRANEETVLIVNVQKSRWGEWAYVNLGCYIRSLGAESNPKESQCHVRLRLEDVTPGTRGEVISGQRHNWPSAASLLPTMADVDEFTSALIDYGIPILETMSTRKGLTSFAREANSGVEDYGTKRIAVQVRDALREA